MRSTPGRPAPDSLAILRGEGFLYLKGVKIFLMQAPRYGIFTL